MITLLVLVVLYFGVCLMTLWGVRDRKRYLEREHARAERDHVQREILAALQKR